MLAAERQCQGVWHSFSFLACDLSLQPRTNIWFCNLFLWTGACASILNCAPEMARKPIYCIKFPNEPWIIPKNNTTLLLFYVDSRNFLKAIRGNGYRFIPKGGTFPSKTIMLVVRSSGLWEAYTQTRPKWDKICTTTCWCRSMIACQVSWISDEFWIY